MPSHRAKVERWAGRAAWAGLGVEALLWAVLSGAPVQSPLLLLGGLVVLVLGTWLCVGVLVVRYRRLFETGYGLAGIVAALSLANWGLGATVPAAVEGLLLMGMMGLMVALPASMALLLRQRDVSAELIGLALLAFVWGILVASRAYGGPVRAIVQYLSQVAATGTGGSEFWWFGTLSCLLGATLPLGSLAFLLHLARLVMKEMRGK